MPRTIRKAKPLIYVFCEGESEQAYVEFLRKQFADVAVIRTPSKTGLFQYAKDLFAKEAGYRNNAEVTDEIWFFFDVEDKDVDHFDQRMKIIRQLRKLRKKPNIKVRLLMTTACIEYWFFLHYQFTAPPLHTVHDKDQMRHKLQHFVPSYAKGDLNSTLQIAQNYQTAVSNGTKTLHALLADGLPSMDESDERNRWLCQSGKTFTTVQEAISFLQSFHTS